MDTNDRLLSIGGQASYPIRDIVNQASPTWYTENYYVDGNVSATGDGSEEYPFSTLAEAFAASHAAIAVTADRHWARRNAIWCCGDTFTETLVALPQKTDVIGCGSYDANSMPGLVGNHAPINSAYGTRFFNFLMRGPAVASPIWTLTSATSGVQFIGCHLQADAAGTTTSGILATAHPFMKVKGCRFDGAFATSYISLGAGQAGGCEIVGNDMLDAAAAGIIIDGSTTSTWGSFIRDNFIKATTLCVDDNSNLFHVIGNKCVTLAACGGAASPTAMDCNLALATGNYVVTSDSNAVYPVAVAAS